MSLPAPDICWQAVINCDSAYDGQFVFAVRTTRIYCRPSCKARLPNRENVDFYPVAAVAEMNGYRACKRCQPKRVNPVDDQCQRIQAICEYIQANLDQSLTLDNLSEYVYWSPYHMQRTFKQVVGITPRQYAEVQRIEQFKSRLKAGSTVTDAALDAGYSSSSRVYAQTNAHLGMTPTEYQQGGEDVTIAYSLSDSPLGLLLLAMTERGVCMLAIGDEGKQKLINKLQNEFPAAYIYRDDVYLQVALQSVLDYLNGWQPQLDLPLDIRVTAFQKRVLEEMRRIPYGETRSYGDLAKAVGSPKAARAVGQVCNRNPVPLIIPCHRVIRSDGSIEGYAYGTERKAYLLDMESQNAQSSE